jgi:hypothetical protein
LPCSYPPQIRGREKTQGKKKSGKADVVLNLIGKLYGIEK